MGRLTSISIATVVLFVSLVGFASQGCTSTVKIASWNVLNLGDETPVQERAEIISQFDIVALQEVESLVGLEALRARVSCLTQVLWKAVVSEKVGQGKAAEYYAFLYRADRVQEAVGLQGSYPEVSPTDFSREPFFATFAVGPETALYELDLSLEPGSPAVNRPIGALREASRAILHMSALPENAQVADGELLLTVNSTITVRVAIQEQTATKRILIIEDLTPLQEGLDNL